MPLYEYKCEVCGEVHEKLVNHSVPDELKEWSHCKSCPGSAKRIVSLGSFELKGDWFKTKGTY